MWWTYEQCHGAKKTGGMRRPYPAVLIIGNGCC